MPASVTNIILRLADRGDGGAGASVKSRPSLIDLANNRLRSNVMDANAVRSDIVANFLPARRYICVMVTGSAWNRVPGRPDPNAAFGVRVKQV